MARRSIHRLHPIQDEESWAFYTQQRDLFWVTAEIDMTQDVKDYQDLKPAEQRVLTHVLAFFASSDSVVSDSLVLDLYEHAPSQEARMFLTMQLAIESVHTETYNALIDTMVPCTATKDNLFNALSTMPCVAAKSQWYQQSLQGASYPEKLWVQTICEGLFFSASFAFIFWIKQRFQGKFPGLTLSNAFIARDEGLHTMFSLMLLRRANNLSQERAHALITEATERELQFISDAFEDGGLLGMSQAMMHGYVRYVASFLCKHAGFDPVFPTAANPFPFMDTIGMEAKVNFFEHRNHAYEKIKVREEAILTFDEDF